MLIDDSFSRAWKHLEIRGKTEAFVLSAFVISKDAQNAFFSAQANFWVQGGVSTQTKSAYCLLFVIACLFKHYLSRK